MFIILQTYTNVIEHYINRVVTVKSNKVNSLTNENVKKTSLISDWIFAMIYFELVKCIFVTR